MWETPLWGGGACRGWRERDSRCKQVGREREQRGAAAHHAWERAIPALDEAQLKQFWGEDRALKAQRFGLGAGCLKAGFSIGLGLCHDLLRLDLGATELVLRAQRVLLSNLLGLDGLAELVAEFESGFVKLIIHEESNDKNFLLKAGLFLYNVIKTGYFYDNNYYKYQEEWAKIPDLIKIYLLWKQPSDERELNILLEKIKFNNFLDKEEPYKCLIRITEILKRVEIKTEYIL